MDLQPASVRNVDGGWHVRLEQDENFGSPASDKDSSHVANLPDEEDSNENKSGDEV